MQQEIPEPTGELPLEGKGAAPALASTLSRASPTPQSLHEAAQAFHSLAAACAPPPAAQQEALVAAVAAFLRALAAVGAQGQGALRAFMQ